MKLYKTVVSLAIIFLNLNLYAERREVEVVDVGFNQELGAYFNDTLPLSGLSRHSSNMMGGGVVYNFYIPLHLKKFRLGISAEADANVVSEFSHVNSWYNFNLMGGFFLDYRLLKWLDIGPNVVAGLTVDKVETDYIANGWYQSVTLRAGPNFKFKPLYFFRKGYTFEINPYYSLSVEDDNNINFGGCRVGFLYHGTNTLVKETVYMDERVSKNGLEVVSKADGTVQIQVPPLAFVSDSEELIDNKFNKRNLHAVFEILNDPEYHEYNILITGYINPLLEEWTEYEKELALGRADTIKRILTDMGINRDRMTTKHGEGSTPFKEYNRRVEFKLYK